MLYWIINAVLIFLFSAIFAGIIIPKILLIAFRRKLFDEPDERKIHSCRVPRLGGLAFGPVLFFSLALLMGINISLNHYEIVQNSSSNLLEILYSYCAILLIYVIGLADDLIGVRYSAKFIIQILCSVLLISSGIVLSNLHGVLGLNLLSNWIAYPLTCLVIVFIINAINLIDGIDGLASGLSCVAFLFYGVLFFVLHEYIYGIVSFGTLGVLVPFYYYNVFGSAEKKQKIFMGDTGSLTIGIMICILSIKMVQTAGNNVMSVNPLVLAFSPLIIPCFDVIRVYIHRVRNGNNPFLPDKNHIHHKLLDVGIAQRNTMVLIVVASILFTGLNFILSSILNINLLIFFDVFIWTGMNMLLSKKIKQHKTL